MGKARDFAAFFGAQSCQKPKLYDRDDANANARLSTRIPYILCISRFAHYLKAMARDKIGSFMERAEMQDWLNDWIMNYVLANPETAGPRAKAEKPLARGPGRGARRQGQARLVRGGRLPAAPLPAGGARRLPPIGSGTAAGEGLTVTHTHKLREEGRIQWLSI